MATTVLTNFNSEVLPTDKPYKHQWARYIARKTLEKDLSAAKSNIVSATSSSSSPVVINLKGADTISQLLEKTKVYTGVGFVPPHDDHPGKFKIGIVGAGVAGLFTALVFDWLNKNVTGLEVDYDILEAAGEDRVGGRLYTHHFSDKEHDYYDVGAMRFPNNKIMERTFRLFDFLGLKQGKEGLIPYYFPPEDDKVCPAYFNDVNVVGNVWYGEKVFDPFKINSGLPKDEKIPEHLLNKDPSKLVASALKAFTDDTAAKFKTFRDQKESSPGDNVRDPTELWKHLMTADKMSVRQFLASKDNGKDFPEGPDFNFNTIEWLETVTFGTGWYDQALTECIFEELDFGTPETKEGEPPKNFWYCIDGGTQKVARLMNEKIEKPVQLHNKVVSINAHTMERGNPKLYVPMTLEIEKKDPETKTVSKRSEDYFTVFNSTTLPALQRMDLKDAGLLWGTKQAIRALGYGASCKVAIKFRTPWWQLPPFNINKGGVSRTDLPLRVCVYPSYNIPEAEANWSPTESSVLLCSYTWGQDAQRLGSLISHDTPDNEEELKSLLLRNLALLHQNDEYPYEKLLKKLTDDEYLTHHAWDWYRDQNMSGAFAYFGPGQFSNMWEEIIKPNAFGQLYLIGEAASSHHAWIVGALESVIRAVYVMFEGLNSWNPKCQVYKDVMTLLTKIHDAPDPEHPEYLPTGLPFYPLPEEMPQRLNNDPAKNESLTYAAAIASMSLVESYFELIYKNEDPSQGGDEKLETEPA